MFIDSFLEWDHRQVHFGTLRSSPRTPTPHFQASRIARSLRAGKFSSRRYNKGMLTASHGSHLLDSLPQFRQCRTALGRGSLQIGLPLASCHVVIHFASVIQVR